MRKILLLLTLIILPVLAYEVYTPSEYSFTDSGDKLLFVIDYSNSMSEYVEHQTKSNLVKEMMNNILPQISPNTSVGLRVYGHTCNILAYNACRSSELIVPLGCSNASLISSKMSKLRPRGMTPITYSLKQAVKKDLSEFSGIKHIILLTDGGENCDESPCDYSIELVKQRKDIKIDVIAFNVHDSDDLDQLRCTANVTGGRFIETDTKAELFNSMQELTTPHKNVEATLFSAN